eukprot:761435-Hanusia_phi.AAC.1
MNLDKEDEKRKNVYTTSCVSFPPCLHPFADPSPGSTRNSSPLSLLSTSHHSSTPRSPLSPCDSACGSDYGSDCVALHRGSWGDHPWRTGLRRLGEVQHSQVSQSLSSSMLAFTDLDQLEHSQSPVVRLREAPATSLGVVHQQVTAERRVRRRFE